MKALEYVSKNEKLKLVTSGYNNKIFITDTHEMICEFTDTHINAILHTEILSKAF